MKDLKNIPMASADLSDLELNKVIEVVKSGRLALGPVTKEFEAHFEKKCGVKHAIAVSSGTAGLHLGLMALGIKAGDEVLVPSYTFVASVNCILYVGATPVFVDVNDDDYSICLEDAKNKINEKTKAIVTVDVFGHPSKLDELEVLCKENSLHLIDDCCEALGAELNGKPVGSFGDMGVFAFYPNKQITTGEGGMVVTDSDEIAQKVRAMMNQGRGAMGQWLSHIYLGFNFRMSEVQAAIGVAQMQRLDEILSKRENVANMYLNELKDCDKIKTQYIAPNAKMSWFVFVVTLADGINRDEVIKKLNEASIPARAYFTPIHEQPYLKDYTIKGVESLKRTENIGTRTLALPFYGDMSEEEVKHVCDSLKSFV
ncbi:MAG: DegT/DnrJ/EryC1/StrS family aminotransferase [Bacteriovoracaceae bacterium]|jgi:perosamine synthetase|nr:DegT/DnrJ/EryC1/StrS family aminotransferase [Bacteriovoracaceae bacterium]